MILLTVCRYSLFVGCELGRGEGARVADDVQVCVCERPVRGRKGRHQDQSEGVLGL